MESDSPLPQRTRLPHAVPAWVQAEAPFFVTICCAERGRNQLCSEGVSDGLLAAVEHSGARGVWWPQLVLLMPDHVHANLSFNQTPGMRKAIRDWKHFCARRFGIRWQRDFFDHRLRDDASLREKATYIRQNPVRAGLCANAEEWPHVLASDAPLNVVS